MTSKTTKKPAKKSAPKSKPALAEKKLLVAMTAAEHEALFAIAKREGVSAGAWLRAQIHKRSRLAASKRTHAWGTNGHTIGGGK